ncbi:MAG: DUF5115 domain-containing protein [Bacteroidales bacterium]|nr:DUF5115 domain-containing protein [Bacteroidales bacterium]
MKKIAYLSVLAGLFLTACTEGDYGIKPADPQVNGQEEFVTLPGVAAAAVSPIDLAKVEDDSVAVATLTPLTVTEGDFKYTIVVDDTYKYPVAEDMKVAVAELQSMVEEVYGKRPTERTFTAVLNVDVIVDGQASLLTSDKFDLTITPVAPVIDAAYWLVGDMCSWDAAGALKFKHSGKDVYEDPVFTITFSTTKESYWKIIPNTNYEGDFWGAGVLGTAVDGDTALDGKLVSESPQAGKIEGAGMYMMTINMMDYTYSIRALAPEYYILGDTPFAWSVNDKKFLMYAESSSVHTYTTEFEGNVKFINANDMGTENWEACYGTPVDGDTSANGSLQQNSGAIHVPEKGFYTFTVDLADMKYSWSAVTVEATYKSMAVVGDFQGWNPANADTQMTEIAPHNWFIGNLNISTSEFKIAADGGWDNSWGEKDMTQNNYGVIAAGGNCKVNPGTYDVFFNDITKHCTILAK